MGWGPAKSGGSVKGVPIIRHFPVNYNDPNILTGQAFYTPTVGDLLLGAWLSISTSWNGTTPKFDFGLLSGGDTTGLMHLALGGSSETSPGSGDTTTQAGALGLQILGSSLNQNIAVTTAALAWGGMSAPSKFVSATPLKYWVTSTGAIGGGSPGSTQGSGVLYIITATPA